MQAQTVSRLVSLLDSPSYKQDHPIPEIILDEDNRTQIVDTTQYPYRCICALRIRSRDGLGWLGSGWLAGPRTVITAGHCVFLHDHGRWAEKIEVIPACNGITQPYGSYIAEADDLWSVNGWINQENEAFDYGAIILPTTYAYGRTLGFFGYVNLSDVNLSGLVLELAGYPADKLPFTLWKEQDARPEMRMLTPYTLKYGIDTTGGQSGAPVFVSYNGSYYVVGIHQTGNLGGNIATRINETVFNNISLWVGVV